MKKLTLYFLIGFGVGFFFSTYQVAQEKQRKEKAELKAKVDRCTGWATRFLTLKNGDNYTKELKGKYVNICLENFPAMIEYYRSIGKKL